MADTERRSRRPLPLPQKTRPTVGLALGSGSARGWAHIGVIQTLQQAQIPIDYVAGTSIGALVGATFCAGRLGYLADQALGMDWRKMARLMDLAVPWGGLVAGKKITTFIQDCVQGSSSDSSSAPNGAVSFEALPTPFAAVATNLRSGQEFVLHQGPLVEAVRASLALPGLLSPVRRGSTWLVDGGLTNPVPVSVCRAMGADIVIAVDLNTDRMVKRHVRRSSRARAKGHSSPPTLARQTPILPQKYFGQLISHYWQTHGKPLETQVEEWMRGFLPLPGQFGGPPVLDVLLSSLHIMQNQLTRYRLTIDPPDFQITPLLGHLHLGDFHRAAEARQAGVEATTALLPRIQDKWDSLSGQHAHL